MANIMRLGGGTGGSGFNIAYGTTPPDDTSKLWVPLTKKPDNVEISGDSLQNAVDAIQTMVAKLDAEIAYTAAASVNGKVYIFGGTLSHNARATILEYDPLTDVCTTKTATLITRRMRAAAVAFNDKIYILGGYTSSTTNSVDVKTIEEYDPATDTIVEKTATIAGANICAVEINGKIYIFGKPKASSIQEYDPETDTIVTKSAKIIGNTLTGSVYNASAVAINNKAYILGGQVSGTIGTNRIQEYDPASDTIVNKSATLYGTTELYNASAVAINGKAYLIGGYDSDAGTRLNTIQEYDPASDTVVVKGAVLATAAQQTAVTEIDGTAYIFGGAGSNNLSDLIQEYTPKAYLGVNHLKLFASVYKNEVTQPITNIVNGKKEQLKLYMTSAFIGDEEGYAKAQDAYVFNKSEQQWQALDGTSMTTDMLNALAELGVT